MAIVTKVMFDLKVAAVAFQQTQRSLDGAPPEPLGVSAEATGAPRRIWLEEEILRMGVPVGALTPPDAPRFLRAGTWMRW